MLKRLNSNSSAASPAKSPRFLIESRMTVLFQGFGNSPSAKNSANPPSNSVADLGSFLWQHKNSKNVRLWIPIALVPLVLLNSCVIYFVFLRGSSSSTDSANLSSILATNLTDSLRDHASFVADQPPQPALPKKSSPGACDLSVGEWIYDPAPPLYTNSTCSHIQLLQNCLRNGRPDSSYLHWRWRPHGCELPRFDPATFLALVRGKKMLFFGDSLARNHMQSLLCSLSQVEQPDKIYSREDKDVKWGFRSYNFTLAIVWSPFLVKHVKVRDDPLLFNLHLDIPHPAWWPSLADYDYALVSASQWFFRPSLYSLNATIVGCNQFSRENYTDIYFMSAYEIALRTTLGSLATLANFTGTTFLRTASPEHFEHGTWSTGGTCNRTAPFNASAAELPWLPKSFNRIQIDEARRFHSENGSKIKVLDVTFSAYLRPDGHPGPYRVYHPYGEVPGAQRRHALNDCLHWCLPGPVDMWNQLLLQELKYEMS